MIQFFLLSFFPIKESPCIFLVFVAVPAVIFIIDAKMWFKTFILVTT